MIKLMPIFIFILFLSCKKEQKVISRPSTLVMKKLGGNFTLENAKGKWSLFESNGRVRLLYFGYTFCPDVCPMALNKLTAIFKNLKDKEKEKILPIFISVDYKRDTGKKVKKYVEYFSPLYIGLAGTQKQIEKVTGQYGVYFKLTPLENSALGYSVDHSSRYFLINKDGSLYKTYSFIEKNEQFLLDFKKLLKE